MTVLAYSELLKRITGIDEKKLEEPFIILNRNNTTKKRLSVLKELVKRESGSIGSLLNSLNFPRGGGSYLNIKRYFKDLEKEGLLKETKIKIKSLWSFSEKYSDLKKFIIK